MKDILINLLDRQDKIRPRSTQTAVGPSEIGDCSRQIWHKVNALPVTNTNTLMLSASMGTAIHAMIEEAFQGYSRYMTEVEVAVGDVMGHIDCIDTKTNTVWDWKTTTKNSLAYFGSEQQQVQIQLYGYLANANGIKVDYVGLVGIARDGNENDIVELVMPYDAAVAERALEKFAEIKAQFDPPRPEKEASFCRNYCSYFGDCPGIEVQVAGEVIENEEIAQLANDYKELQKQSKAIDAQIDYIKTQLDGTSGVTTDGVTIKWSQVAGRQTVDESAVQEALGFVPKKQGNGYSRLTIK